MPLLALPNELLLNILQTITSPRDIYNFLRTCRRLAHLLLPTLHELARQDKDGVSALRWACLRGHEGLAQFLLAEGVSASSGSPPALFSAIAGRNPTALVPLLISHGATTTALARDSNTLLHAAAAAGHEPTVQLLLDRAEIPIDTTNNAGETPLYLCCTATTPSPALAQLLLARGANPDLATSPGQHTPLHAIASNRAATAPALADRLLASGAHHAATTTTGSQTPLHVAAEHGTAALVDTLLRHGAAVAAKDDAGRTPLHLAAARGTDPKICEVLLQHGAELTERDFTGYTPIDSAAVGAGAGGAGAGAGAAGTVEAAFEATIRVLLSRGASRYSSRTLDGQLLLWAVKNGHEDVLRMILEQGVDVNVRDAEGRTPLHWAALFGMVEIVRVLLERGADGGAVAAEGKTALALAAARGEDAVVEMLVERGGGGVWGCGEADRRRPPPAAHGARRGVVVVDGDAEGVE
ncbi:ankyrin repeat-containing domain protein [Morchella snyderi]|nr:ankyrin repeat-containing domain protein [Morchella snyderi]